MKQPFARRPMPAFRASQTGVKLPVCGSQLSQKTPAGTGYRRAYDPSSGRLRAYIAPLSSPSSNSNSNSVNSSSVYYSMQQQQVQQQMQQQRRMRGNHTIPAPIPAPASDREAR